MFNIDRYCVKKAKRNYFSSFSFLVGFNEALISLWLVLLWLMFKNVWFGCDCIYPALLPSAFPLFKISFSLISESSNPELTLKLFYSFLVFFKYIWSQHAGLVFISAKRNQGEGILAEMEPVLCQRLHLWVEGAPCWTCVSASQCKHELSFDRMHHILPASLCLLIRLIFTFGLMVRLPLGDTCFNLDQIQIMQSEVLDAPRVNSCFD